MAGVGFAAALHLGHEAIAVQILHIRSLVHRFAGGGVRCAKAWAIAGLLDCWTAGLLAALTHVLTGAGEYERFFLSLSPKKPRQCSSPRFSKEGIENINPTPSLIEALPGARTPYSVILIR
jgi:hypothetical protein